jgi:glutamine amidotransferase-like uncharacterized protein
MALRQDFTCQFALEAGGCFLGRLCGGANFICHIVHEMMGQ